MNAIKTIGNIKYLYINVNDNPDANIKKYFSTIINFIDETKKNGGKCLVHCA